LRLNPNFINRYRTSSPAAAAAHRIARALVLNPNFIRGRACLPLDVSIQAQIVNLMEDLQDPSTSPICSSPRPVGVNHMSDRIAVMYLASRRGCSTAEVRDKPPPPYTKVLQSSVPIPDRISRCPAADPAQGEIPSPVTRRALAVSYAVSDRPADLL